MKLFDKVFKNPLKKDSTFEIVSKNTIDENNRLEQAKKLLRKQLEEKIDENDEFEDEDEFADEDEDGEFERDENLSRTETIDPLKIDKRKLDSLQQIYAQLDKEEKEQNLKLKILKKKESIAKKQEKFDELVAIQKEKDRFYEEPRNAEGYFVLKEEKWNREYDELMIKLAKAETDDDRKPIQKKLKRLEWIKRKNKQKNTANKIFRGINKTTAKIGTVTQGIGKFADEMSKMGGGQVGGGSKSKTNFENFFSDSKPVTGTGGKRNEYAEFENFFKDKPSVKQSAKSTPKRKTKTKKKKKKKGAKKKKKTAKKTSTPKAKPTNKNKWENFFKD